MLIETMNDLQGQGTGLRSLTEQINTTTPAGRLVEFERDLIRERTRAGLAAARARGRQGGRPKKSGTPCKVTMARSLYANNTDSC